MLPRGYKYYWFCQVSGWTFVVLSMLFFAYSLTPSKIDAGFFMRLGLIFSAGIFTTHILRAFIRSRGWLLLPVEKLIPRMMVAIIVTSIACSLLYMGLVNLLGVQSDVQRRIDFSTKLLASTMDIGLFIIPWTLIYYIYHYVAKSRKQEVDTLKLEALVKALELKTIKAHINPHFIFNALNSIRALIDENPQRARNAVTELSNLLRSSMQSEKSETVPLERELNIVRDYLALEHIRFEDRLQVEFDVDEDTLDQPVPPMMLQTLVENAIKHGIGKQMRGGVVRISSDFKDDYHELMVQNTGRLNGEMNGEGFGISSTRNRLQLLFGNKADFSIRETNGNLVEAMVKIPVSAVTA
ncbi:sensor histidine kinase [Flavihumibacter sp. ZG627]|uniref:sensor histidine kinase n=1 Tax=Flavihumibacter sp. ZG627 TaxID=1463156 RepID=UPI00057EE9C9|nr:histidine kinase [Flavihumibacter sp. ZG627]KIC89157.1 histidine kinase [Flavihumibacter sp. ZG627]